MAQPWHPQGTAYSEGDGRTTVGGLGTGIECAHRCQGRGRGVGECLSLVVSKATPGWQELLRDPALRLPAPTIQDGT